MVSRRGSTTRKGVMDGISVVVSMGSTLQCYGGSRAKSISFIIVSRLRMMMLREMMCSEMVR